MQVIVSAGGGAAGLTLLKAALAARRAGCLADTTWRLFAGNRLPEADFAALCATALANVSVERFHDNLPGLMRGCRVSVSQAGYNTVLDILRARARAVVVPYAAGRETEQLLRAERLAALGAVELVREAELSPETLAAAMQRAASAQPRHDRDRPRWRGAVGRSHRRDAGSARRCCEAFGRGREPGYDRSMSYLPRVTAATTADWAALADEFDRWGQAGRVAALWWRDDDAVMPTPQLAELLGLAGDVPVGLAVIPALAHPELADALGDAPGVAVLQHGWRHANHATTGKKSEYPEGRDPGPVAAELGAGMARLRSLFGARALPLLVPPWNRIAPEFLPLLPLHGIAGLSAIPPRGRREVPAGLAMADVHVDRRRVAWRQRICRRDGGAGRAGRLAARRPAGRPGSRDAGRGIDPSSGHGSGDGGVSRPAARGDAARIRQSAGPRPPSCCNDRYDRYRHRPRRGDAPQLPGERDDRRLPARRGRAGADGIAVCDGADRHRAGGIAGRFCRRIRRLRSAHGAAPRHPSRNDRYRIAHRGRPAAPHRLGRTRPLQAGLLLDAA